MRNFLAVLCLTLCGVLAATSMGGWQIDQLLRSEEPISEIAGGLPHHEEFTDSMGEMLVEEAAESIHPGLENAIPGNVEEALSPVVTSALDNERTAEAWEEVLQNSRAEYTAQLEDLFHEGTTGDTAELNMPVNLTPVTEAVSEPIRDGLESNLDWVPGVDDETFDILAPDVELDVETATDSEADPYTWATVATMSQYWLAMGIAAAALGLAGLLLGTGRTRWVATVLGAGLAALIGAGVLAAVLLPDFSAPSDAPEAVEAFADYVVSGLTGWVQPPWWIFTGISVFVSLAAVLAAAATPAQRRRRPSAEPL